MKKYILVALSCISATAFSAEVPKSDITHINPWTPFVDVQMNTPTIDPENCGNSNTYRVDLVDDAGGQAKLSVLLAAFMAGKQVGLVINGCVKGRPKIEAVRLSK
ncbi:hypothetical protein [Microbulbifer spongiae]|uniref:Uncharacterized protein n=1 Tax=Microbulbifer spongiae TaxID=2944933 RepID=A0ABY9E7C8_9GAMM|nr:hypothetical protein [Microbulbifer sp. MI-G]WKD48939.1 hypothetical protein M8T91_13695 [Microbulbifer sp. MI-G]